jgi:hypothetical protein
MAGAFQWMHRYKKATKDALSTRALIILKHPPISKWKMSYWPANLEASFTTSGRWSLALSKSRAE